MSTATTNSADPSARRAWPMRLWLAAPDWAFRVAGAVFFFAFVGLQAKKYWDWPLEEWGPYYRFPDGSRLLMPWVPVLVDLTFVLIALSFCFRIPPRNRAANGWIVLYALLTGFAPLLVLWSPAFVGLFNESWQQSLHEFMWRADYTWQLVLLFGSLLTAGNALDVWGYSKLWKSLSIVPEARDLKTTGPYRFVRHPIYLGHFLAQAGMMLVAMNSHWVWISLYVLFLAMQLYRSKLEDRVLEKAFGEPYRVWKDKTFWFV